MSQIECAKCFTIMTFVETYNGNDLYTCHKCGYKCEVANPEDENLCGCGNPKMEESEFCKECI